MDISGEHKGRVLIVGADSTIGRSLAAHFRNVGTPVIETSRRSEATSEGCLFLDLSQDISEWQPPANISVAFLCAAVTSLETCRNNPQLTRTINVDNTGRLARAFAARGIFTVFISTNLVFDGSVPFQHQEAIPCPTTEYGRQKAEAESILLGMGVPAAVIRLTKVVTPDAPLFHNWIHSLKKNKAIHPFSDVKFSPIPLDFTTTVLSTVAARRINGIVQVSGNNELAYSEAALHVAGLIGADLALVQPILSCESGLNIEAIPAHATLDTGRLEHELKITPSNIWHTIEKVCSHE